MSVQLAPPSTDRAHPDLAWASAKTLNSTPSLPCTSVGVDCEPSCAGGGALTSVLVIGASDWLDGTTLTAGGASARAASSVVVDTKRVNVRIRAVERVMGVDLAEHSGETPEGDVG